jgi:hypothetical protein
MSKTVKFSQIQIGKKFKTNNNITYQKTSNTKAKPVFSSTGTVPPTIIETSAFQNSTIQLTVVS